MKQFCQQLYRVECNFGCKYFDSLKKAGAYFQRKVKKRLDVELWLVTYIYCAKQSKFIARQELLGYSATALPKA